MKTSDFDYHLPPERIAQTPVEPRHASRLLVLNRALEPLEHTTFWEIERFFRPGDLLVLNQTRVIPARVYARKLPTGGRVELLLLRREDDVTWEVLAGGKRMVVGRQLQLEDGPSAMLRKRDDDDRGDRGDRGDRPQGERRPRREEGAAEGGF